MYIKNCVQIDMSVCLSSKQPIKSRLWDWKKDYERDYEREKKESLDIRKTNCMKERNQDEQIGHSTLEKTKFIHSGDTRLHILKKVN